MLIFCSFAHQCCCFFSRDSRSLLREAENAHSTAGAVIAELSSCFYTLLFFIDIFLSPLKA